MEIGMTTGLKSGVTTFKPSTALNTEIAGVMAPSLKSSAAPTIPRNGMIDHIPDLCRAYPVHQRHEGQYSAFAFVVRLHDEIRHT